MCAYNSKPTYRSMSQWAKLTPTQQAVRVRNPLEAINGIPLHNAF